MIAHDLIDLSHPRRLHLLGIGGSGMTPFARLLAAAAALLVGIWRRSLLASVATGLVTLYAGLFLLGYLYDYWTLNELIDEANRLRTVR